MGLRSDEDEELEIPAEDRQSPSSKDRHREVDPAFDPSKSPKIGKRRVGPPTDRKKRSKRREERRQHRSQRARPDIDETKRTDRSKRRQERKDRRERRLRSSKAKAGSDLTEIKLSDECKSPRLSGPSSPRKAGWSLS